jgi:hypothetical protein
MFAYSRHFYVLFGVAQIPTKAQKLFKIFINNILSKCISVNFSASAKYGKQLLGTSCSTNRLHGKAGLSLDGYMSNFIFRT